MLLSAIFGDRGRGVGIGAATPENPRFSLNDPAAWDALGAQPAASGVRVNRSTALQYSAYFRALSLISASVAKLPLILYRKQANGKVEAEDHPVNYLLQFKPNEEQTAFSWMRCMQVQMLAEGNAFSWINRRAGIPVELIPLDAQKTFPVRESGRLWYITEIRTDKVKLPSWEVLHFPGMSYDGMMGLSITECARESLGIGMGAQRYGAVFFKNQGKPSIALKHPMKLDPRTRLALSEDWGRMHTNIDNAHRVALLDGGLELQEFGSRSAQEAQLLETLKFSFIDIANFFDCPPHKLGDRSSTGYASLEQENQAFLDDCLDPRLIVIEQQCWDKLLTEEEKLDRSHILQFDRQRLIQVNMQTKAAYNRAALGGAAWKSVNEVREEEGENPTDNPADDQIAQPLNMGQGGADHEPDDNAGPRPGGQPKAQGETPEITADPRRDIFRETARRMVARVGRHGAHLERGCKSAQAYAEWLASFHWHHEQVFACAFAKGFQGCPAGPWLIRRLHDAFTGLADTATAANLRTEAFGLAARLEAELPDECADYFFGELPGAACNRG